MTKNALILTLAIPLLTACGSGGNNGGQAPEISPTHASGASPSPQPSATASPSPSPSTPTCKDLNSVWHTSETPNTPFLGVYLGPPTNGPVFDLNLSNLGTGRKTFIVGDGFECYYDVTLTPAAFTLDSFHGCNQAQCDSCPFAASSNVVFNYALSCNALSIQNVSDNQTLSYQ